MTAPNLLEIARVAPGLTAQDFEDMSHLDLATLADLLDLYVATGRVPDRGAWEAIGRALQAATPYFQLGGAILSIVSGGAALIR